MQTVGWGKQRFKNFLSVSSIIASISKHSLTKWYLYILRRKALIISFCVCVNKPFPAHKACRILDMISAQNTVSMFQVVKHLLLKCLKFNVLVRKKFCHSIVYRPLHSTDYLLCDKTLLSTASIFTLDKISLSSYHLISKFVHSGIHSI